MFRIIRPVLLVALLAASLPGVAQTRAFSPDEYRYVTSTGRFDGTSQFAVAYRLRSPRLFQAHRLELAVGSVFSDSDSGLFASLGPVWRLPLAGYSSFVDVGLSPTVISRSTFNGRDPGGNVHFTSRIAVGTRFGRYRDYSLSLQAQHTSNGGINGHNPGLDMIGLTFAVEFRD